MLVLKELGGVLLERRRNRERAMARVALARADSGALASGWLGCAPGFATGSGDGVGIESVGVSSVVDGAESRQDPFRPGRNPRSLRSG